MTTIAATSGKCYFNEAEYRRELKVEFITDIEKVYVVKASSGEFDTCREWIHAVYLTEKEATTSRDALKEKMRCLKEIPCPVDDTFLEDLSDDDLELYEKWVIGFNEASNFNSAVVDEYELGRIYE